MLETINETHWIIDVLLLGGRDLLIVEPRRFLRAVYSDGMKWDDMKVVEINDDHKRPQCNIVAATIHWDPLLNQEFVFILKDSGALEILDGELRTIDLFETGIEQTGGTKFLATDDTSGRLFVNLTENAIYSLAIRRMGDTIRFIEDGGNPRCVYQAPGRILFYEAVWHVDLESGGEFMTIAALVDTYVQSNLCLEVIRQTQRALQSKKSDWKPLIELTRLENLRISSSDRTVPATLKTVPNVGIFVFAYNCTIFFTVPCGAQHSINGSLISDSMQCKGLQPDVVESGPRRQLGLLSTVFFKQSVKGLEFTLFSDSWDCFSAKLDLVFEHPEEYTYEWGDITVERATIPGGEDVEGVDSSVMGVVSVDGSTALLWSRWKGLLFIDLTTVSEIQSLNFSQPSALYTGRVGHDINRLVSCCGFDGSKGCIQTLSYGYENLLIHLEDISSSAGEVDDAWLTEDNLWWKCENGLLRSKDIIVEQAQDVKYVTWTGDKLTASDSALISSSIWNDEDGHFVSLFSDGHLRWSMSTGSVRITSNSIPLDAQLHLTCRKNQNGTYSTVVNIANNLTLLSDKKVIDRGNLKSHWKDLSICDLFIVPSQELRYMLIGTSDGKINLFNLQSLRVQETLRLSSKRIRFCGIPKSPYVFAYTEEDLLLIEINDLGGCNFTKVHITSRIKLIKSRSITEIYIFEKGGSLSRFRLRQKVEKPLEVNGTLMLPSHVPTKFISFACSNRLIVASSMSATYSTIHSDYTRSSCLQLLDTEAQELLFSYDFADRYPQATISDIVAIPYEGSHINGEPLRKELLYAKRLTLSRCFLVALNYENAEDDSLDNLLLFSIDENKCTIDFHCGLKTQFVITTLGNYHANMFIVCGEFLQIFKIDYLIQENAFRLSRTSNALPTCGYSTKVVGKILDAVKSEVKEKSQSAGKSDSIFVVNLLEGLQEYSVSTEKVSLLHSTDKPTTYQVDPVPGSRKKDLIVGSTENNSLLIDCAWVVCEQTLWIAVAYSDCCVEFCPIEMSEDDRERKIKMVSIKFECRVTAVATSVPEHQVSRGGTDFQGYMFKISKAAVAPLFYVSTSRGGIYALEEVYLRQWLKEEE